MSTVIYHKHHIIPKHAGGTDHPDNIARLTPEEHAEAHRLLYEKYDRWQDKIAYEGLLGFKGKEQIIKEIQSRPKSEEEKKQHRTPGLNTIHQKPGNRNQGKIPLWALVVGGVVFVGFLGLIVWFVLLADTPQTADVTAPRPAKAQPIIRQPQLQNPGLDRESRVVSPAPARPVSPMPARQSRQRPVAQADHFQAGLTPQI